MAKEKSKNVLGLYISPKEIVLSEVQIKGAGKLQPEHLVKFSTDFPRKEGAQRPMSLNAAFFNNSAAWVAKFKAAVKKVDWSSSETVVTLSENFAVLRYFVMPNVNRKFWSKAIPLESKKYIPLSFEDVIFDYNGFTSDNGKKLNVLFGVSQRSTINFIANLLKECGFNLHSVEITSISMERLLAYIDPKDHNNKAYIHASADATHLLFSTGGRPVLHREFENEGGSMTERRRFDLKGGIQFVERYSAEEDKFKYIALSGEYASMLKENVEREASPMPVIMWDTTAACSSKDSSSASLFAIGAALIDKVPSKFHLDISGISNNIRINNTVQKYTYSVGAVICAILLFMILGEKRKLYSVTEALQNLSAQNIASSDLSGGSVDEIRAKIENMRKESKSLSNLFSSNDYVGPKLTAISDEIYNDLSLDTIYYANPMAFEGSGQQIGCSMTLNGSTALTGEARTSTIEEFVKDLKKYESEFKKYLPPKGTVTLTVSAAAAGKRGGSPDEVSKFTIAMVGGK